MIKYILWFPGYLVLSAIYFLPSENWWDRSVESSKRLWSHKDIIAPFISVSLYLIIGLGIAGRLHDGPYDSDLAKGEIARLEGRAFQNHNQGTSEHAPPAISVFPTATTSTNTVDLVGRVIGEGKLASLTVDSSNAVFKPDGSFSFRRVVPIGVSDIRLVATNEWGQSTEVFVQITRTVPKAADAEFASLAPERIMAARRPQAIALIIGIDRYENVPPAEFAENDAKSFYDYATNALGVPPDRVKLLTGSDARRLDIRKALLTWAKPQVVHGQSDVFIFFSGHGLASDDGQDLFLLPYDGDRTLLADSAILRKEIIDTFVGAGAASTTLFLDTCYSGGTRGNETLVVSARPILIRAKKEGLPANVTILAASGSNQLSSTLDQTKHGLFSYFLMKGLEGDAAEGEHVITAAKLEAYLADHIPGEAARLGRTQTPQLLGDSNRVLSSW